MAAVAAALSVIALGIPLGLGWWLYLSPGQRPRPGSDRRLSLGVGALLGLAAFLQVAGALWDAGEHVRTGQVPGGADFLWPPHLVIYGGFLLAFLAAGGALAGLGIRHLRGSARSRPGLGPVVLAALYGLLSIPADALWHQLFGPDLTAWSPPHLLLAAAMVGEVVGGAWVVAAEADRRWANLLAAGLLGLALDAALLVGVLEWELPGGRALAVAYGRPGWLYPTVTGILAFAAFGLGRRLLRLRFGATAVGAVAFGVRAGLTGLLGLGGTVVPALPLPFIAGALGFDLTGGRGAAGVAGLVGGYLALAIPAALLRRPLGLPELALTGGVLTVAGFGAARLADAARRRN